MRNFHFGNCELTIYPNIAELLKGFLQNVRTQRDKRKQRQKKKKAISGCIYLKQFAYPGFLVLNENWSLLQLALISVKCLCSVLLMQAKVRELEEKCRTQSEQFNLLSRELEKFRQQAGKIDLLSSNPLTSSDISGSPSKSLSQLMNGIATSLGKGKDKHFICRSVLPYTF